MPHWKAVREILGQQIPASSTMFVMMISGFIVLMYLRGFGDSAQAAFAIALRIEQIFLLPALGMTSALLPIVAQNFGAEKSDRVVQALRTCLAIGFVYMLLVCPMLWLFADTAMRIFTDDPEVIAVGVSYLHIDGIILPVYLVLFSLNSVLQGLRKPSLAFWIGVYRQGIGVPLFIWIFVGLLGFDVIGVWFGIAASVITGLVVSALITEWAARPVVGSLLARPAA